jgi:hypothetical protein
VSDHEVALGRLPALLENQHPVGRRHFETVDHHQRRDRYIEAATA